MKAWIRIELHIKQQDKSTKQKQKDITIVKLALSLSSLLFALLSCR